MGRHAKASALAPAAEPTICKYTVSPFSQENPLRPTREVRSDESTCAICNRVVREPAKHLAIVVRAAGGFEWGDESDESDPRFVGQFAVGAGCHKRFAVRPK